MPFDEIAPAGERSVEQWDKVREGFGQVAAWYAKKRNDGPFIMGTEVSWADFVVGAHLVWLNKAWGDDDPKWKAVMQWDDGTWENALRCVEGVWSVRLRPCQTFSLEY